MAALRALGEDGDFEGKEFVTRCPFHEDVGRRAHLYINIQNKPGVYHCFWAGCEVRGEFLTFVQQKTGWNYVLATAFMRRIARDVPFTLTPPKAKPLPRSVKELDPFAYRHAYCYDRGLTEATLVRYRIGYDKTKDALTFPWFDRNRRLVGIKFRPFTSGRYLCEKGVEVSSHLFGLQLVRQSAIVWIAEGEFDTMFLDQCFRQLHADNHFAVGLGGKTLHPKAIQELLRVAPKRVVLMLDNDEPGIGATKKILSDLVGKVAVRVATYPEVAKDPNQCSLETINTNVKQMEIQD